MIIVPAMNYPAFLAGTRTSPVDKGNMAENRYLQFVLASLVLFGPGLRFFRKGVPNLLRWTPDMPLHLETHRGRSPKPIIARIRQGGAMPHNNWQSPIQSNWTFEKRRLEFKARLLRVFH